MEDIEDINVLRELYNQERKQRIQLEEECDLLALENVRLQEELNKLKHISLSSSNSTIFTSNSRVDINKVDSEGVVRPKLEIKQYGDNLYANSFMGSIPKACNDKNVLSIAILFLQDRNDLNTTNPSTKDVSFMDQRPQSMNDTTGNEITVCGGVDNHISLYHSFNMTFITRFQAFAPVIALSVYESRIAAAIMDGSIIVIDYLDYMDHMKISSISSIESSEFIDTETNDDNNNNRPYRMDIKRHTKFVISIEWNDDGTLLATASYDKTVNLYRFERQANTESGRKFTLSLLTSLKFSLNPESLVFNRSDETKEDELIIALRDTYNLVYVSCKEPYIQRLISMNEAIWDTHTSFSALYISISPNKKLLAIANDKNAIILIDNQTYQRLQILVGHNCSEYGKPKLAWDQSSQYLYCNSDGEHVIYVYSLYQGKIVDTLLGHSGLVKDIKSHPTKRQLITASFDHSVIVWGRK